MAITQLAEAQFTKAATPAGSIQTMNPLNWVDPTAPQFGGKCDSNPSSGGGTDDTVAVTAAVDYIHDHLPFGGTLYLPGYCRITSGIAYTRLISNLFQPITIVGSGKYSSGLVCDVGPSGTCLDLGGSTASIENITLVGVNAGIGMLMARYGSSDSGAHKITNVGEAGSFAIATNYLVGMEETDFDHVDIRVNQSAPIFYISERNDLGVTSPSGNIVSPISLTNVRIHGASTIRNYGTGRAIVISGTCSNCLLEGNFIAGNAAGIFLTGPPSTYSSSIRIINNEFEIGSSSEEPGVLLGDTHLYNIHIADNVFNDLNDSPDIMQVDQTGSGALDGSILEGNYFKHPASLHTVARSTIGELTPVQVRFLSQNNRYSVTMPRLVSPAYDIGSIMPGLPVPGTGGVANPTPPSWARDAYAPPFYTTAFLGTLVTGTSMVVLPPPYSDMSVIQMAASAGGTHASSCARWPTITMALQFLEHGPHCDRIYRCRGLDRYQYRLR
jgi:hypothetical protein